jgi:hypothetical protein
MYAIRLASGAFLDIPANFDINFELNNQVFSTAQNDVLPGSFSFPVDLPLSRRNKKLLKLPHDLQNAYRWQHQDGVTVYCHGAPLFTGTLKITEATRFSVKVYVVSEPIKGLKELTLGQAIQDDYERSLGATIIEKLSKLKRVARQPDDYDYTFFPVRATNYDDTAPSGLEESFMNYYDGYGASFSNLSAGIVPFVRIDWILAKVFAAANPDFKFINSWQTSRELRRLYLLNGFDARESNGTTTPALEPYIDLRNHVGNGLASDLLKGLMGLFCLGLFTSPFQKRIQLRALRDVLKLPPKHDWTEHALADYTIADTDNEVPAKFCHPQPEDSPSDVPENVPYPSFSSWQEFSSDLATLAPGRYYIEAEELVVEVADVDGSNVSRDLGIRRRCVKFADAPAFESKIGVPLTWEFAGEGHYPWTLQPGSYWQQEADPAEWVRVINDFPFEIVFYRGFQQAAGSVINERPYASNDVWRPSASPLPIRAKITTVSNSGVYTEHGEAQHSLLWYSDRGLYAQWWSQWHTMLRSGKHVTMQFTLPVATVMAFDFADKVRVHNQDYFIKRLRIGKALSQGRVLVEASMVSIV